MSDKKLPIIETLNLLEEQLKHSKMAYYALNDDLKKYHKLEVTKETFIHLHKCMIAMDDIFAEEIGPVLQFIANHFVEATEMSKKHYEFKIENAKIDQEMRKEASGSNIILP